MRVTLLAIIVLMPPLVAFSSHPATTPAPEPTATPTATTTLPLTPTPTPIPLEIRYADVTIVASTPPKLDTVGLEIRALGCRAHTVNAELTTVVTDPLP